MQNWITLKYRPAHHSVSLDSAYLGRDSGVVRYKRASLELGPVLRAKRWVLKWILDPTILPTFDPTIHPHVWFHVLSHFRVTVNGHKTSSDQRTIIRQSTSMTFAALSKFKMPFLMRRRVRFATSRLRILLFATSSSSTSLRRHYYQVHARSWSLLQLCWPTMMYRPNSYCPTYFRCGVIIPLDKVQDHLYSTQVINTTLSPVSESWESLHQRPSPIKDESEIESLFQLASEGEGEDRVCDFRKEVDLRFASRGVIVSKTG